MRRAISCPEGLRGPASTIVASRLLMAGRRSIRSSALWTCAAFRRTTSIYYKAWWGAEPVLHLFPHWNWEERMGEPMTVWVHSNLDEVELFLNGKSLGSKKVSRWGTWSGR